MIVRAKNKRGAEYPSPMSHEDFKTEYSETYAEAATVTQETERNKNAGRTDRSDWQRSNGEKYYNKTKQHTRNYKKNVEIKHSAEAERHHTTRR